jgi:uncharacterized protein YgiM (DUF1202 family)
MKNINVIVAALVLTLTLACAIPLSSPPQPQPSPIVVTQVIVVPADTATTAPILPTDTQSPPSVTPLPSLTPLPTITPTNPASPTPTVPTATLIKNANCRHGPSQIYEVVTSFLKGQALEIVGRNEDLSNTWWQVKIPNSRSKCWISLTTAQATGNMDDIPIIYPPY